MRTTNICIAVTCCALAAAVVACAQTRKAGLWEMTTTMTLQQSPFPPGMAIPANSPLNPAPRTTQVCLTQAMIDKYGAPVPPRNDCRLANVQKGELGMTADLVCSGRMTGKGELTSSWPDPEHAKGSVHFIGTVQAGPNPGRSSGHSNPAQFSKGPTAAT